MELEHWVEAAGPPGLAAAAFLGATVVPISSELALVAALRLGHPPVHAIAWATMGNSLGCALNYVLGRWGRGRLGARLVESSVGQRALDWTDRWGAPALLLSWLPLIGDPLTVAAGIARVRPWVFATLVVPLRVARYFALVPLG